MSDSRERSVSWFTVLVVFVGLGLFLMLVKHYYRPEPAPVSFNVAPEQFPADRAWQATPEGRLEHRDELEKTQREELNSYGWIDQSKGTVRLPISRAMELTVSEINRGAQK